MDAVHNGMARFMSLLLAPFYQRPAAGLLVLSVLTGVVMTYVFGLTSNQKGLKLAADKIRAQLFGVKLFKEDLVVTFQCQMALLRWTAMRLWYSVPPMLVMLIPLFLVLSQLAMRYEHRPLVRDERAVVTVRCLPDQWKAMRDQLELLDGERFDVETAGLRDEKNNAISWRVRATGDESEAMRWKWNEHSFSKVLPMAKQADELAVASPRRPDRSLGDRLMFPAEPTVAMLSTPIESIDLQLTHRETPLFGFNIPWWGTFFLVSMITAFAVGKWIGVQY